MQHAAESLDRIMTLEIQGRALPRGVKLPLYEVVRAAHREPLALAAARLLDRQAAKVALVTGAAVPVHMPAGENDGPLGTIVLARALNAVGHHVEVYTDPEAAPAIRALLSYLGLAIETVELQQGDMAQQDRIAAEADIAVAVERLGGNCNGILYGATGKSRSEFRCNVDRIFRDMAAAGKPTISIADGGNEIGFGKVYEDIKARFPEIDRAETTPCGGGIFSVVPTDVLVVATSSNIGTYAVVAALALLRSDPDLCHRPEEERALEYIGVGLGLTDGGSGRKIAAVDGVGVEDNAAVVGLMRTIVIRAHETAPERIF